jgi:hypothetical protein
VRQDASRKLLARAAAQIGGVDALAKRLGTSSRVLQHYITGHDPVPEHLVLQVIDVILDQLPKPPSDS